MHGLAHQDPAHVRPPLAVERSVWIAFLIRMLMMNAVCGHPENGPAFESKSRTRSQNVFHPVGRSIASMSEQPVIAHANAKASRNPPEKHSYKQGLPGEKEQGCNRAKMKQRHKSGGYPIDFIVRGRF